MKVSHLKAMEEQADLLFLFLNPEKWSSLLAIPEVEKWVHDITLLMLAKGDTFFISTDVLNAVAQCRQNIPSGMAWESRWMPTQRGWMKLETPVAHKFEEGYGFIHAVGWWECEPDHYLLTILGMIEASPLFSFTRIWFSPNPGQTIAELQKAEGVRDPEALIVPWVYSLFYTMFLPAVANVDYQKISPLARDMVIRKTHQQPRPDIRIVTLRRLSNHGTGAGEQHRKYDSCRWMVGANFKHWRNQYHPSTGEHKWIHIPPFIKGPADKPLRMPTKTIYQVTR